MSSDRRVFRWGLGVGFGAGLLVLWLFAGPLIFAHARALAAGEFSGLSYTRVVVATRDIAAGEVFHPSMVEERPLRTPMVFASSVTWDERATLVGRTFRTPVHAGATVSTHHLVLAPLPELCDALGEPPHSLPP